LKEVSGSWFCDVFVATAGLPSALLILLAMFKQIQIRFVDLERITNWFYCIVYCNEKQKLAFTAQGPQGSSGERAIQILEKKWSQK